MRKPAFILFGGYTRSIYHQFIPLLHQMNLMVLVLDLPNSEKICNQAGLNSNAIEAVFCEGGDLATVMRTCKQWKQQYILQGALNTIEEFTLSSAIAIDFLSLKGPGMKACLIASNKTLQRSYLEKWGPMCHTIISSDPIPEAMRYPAILKATNLHGGHGMVLVHSILEAQQSLSEFPDKEPLNFEEYIEGQDISVESIVQNGKIIFQNLTEEDHLYAKGHHLEMGHALPATQLNPKWIQRVYDMNQLILKEMDFQDGMTHAEYRVTEKGQIFLIEIAARPPGDGIMALYQLSTGQLIEETVLNTALGKSAYYPDPIRYTKQIFLQSKPGNFDRIEFLGTEVEVNCYPESLSNARDYPAFCPDGPAALREIVQVHRKGTNPDQLIGPDSRLAWMIVDADSPRSLEELITRTIEQINLVMDGNRLCCT